MTYSLFSLVFGWLFFQGASDVSNAQVPDLVRIKPGIQTGFSNGGWNYDRYPDLERLDARKRMLVADLKGPGIIRALHTTRHNPKDLFARGIVLEVWYDEAKTPAVQAPLADFFGDGCNGSGMDFTSNLIECAPWAYNCYIPMPFKQRARVYLRNDTDRNAMNYSFVEWEKLPHWDDAYGYFHATYRRDAFQLSKSTRHTFLELKGKVHILGRQFSLVTNEPHFDTFNTVMEGNNEIDIDGRERAVDYLGTEDSFTFSWGFQKTFAGQHAGMTLVDVDDLSLQRLSVFRFHDSAPIRFEKSLKWSIDWTQEKAFTGNPTWQALVDKGGCWVDYAAVHYWYQDDPGGFVHAPLPSVAERAQISLCPDRYERDLVQTVADMDAEGILSNTFDSQRDLSRLRILNPAPGTHPVWIEVPKSKGGHPGNPNPGRTGILALHPASVSDACLAIRKVKLPPQGDPYLSVVLSGDPFEFPEGSDFMFQAGVVVDGRLQWFPSRIVTAGGKPSAENWLSLVYSLTPYQGKEVGLVVKIAAGGKLGTWRNEEGFLDEFSVKTH